MKNQEVTVSDLVALIEAREETRAELQQLVHEAYQYYRALESKVQELESRLNRAHAEVSEVRIRAAAPISAATHRKAG